MKTIIATVAAAAVITAGASVAGAQELGGSTGGVSPYVGFEYETTPNDAVTGDWFGGDATSTVVIGAEAALPWNLKADGSLSVANGTDKFNATPADVDSSAIDFGGFAIDGASLTVSYEVMDGMDIYSTTEFNGNFIRESTSVGMLWKF